MEEIDVKTKEWVRAIEDQASNSFGHQGIIKSQIPLLLSNAEVVKALEDFKKSSVKSEKWMQTLVLLSILITFAQLILAWVSYSK